MKYPLRDNYILQFVSVISLAIALFYHYTTSPSITDTFTMIDPKYCKSHIYKFSKMISSAAVSKPKNYVQLYLDYDCPFSAKMFKKFNDEVFPLLAKEGIEDQFQFIFMNVVQPWHGFNSAALHEVSLSVAKNYPELFWDVSSLLFTEKDQFVDSATYDMTRRQLNSKIIDVITSDSKFANVIDKAVINADVEIDTSVVSNAGNKVAKEIKYFTRYHRTIGVHVTPTVSVNGIIAGNIESSTDASKVVDILKSYL